MPRYDAILITTVYADTPEQAEDFMRDYADGLADTEHAPFTGLLDTGDTDNDGQRVFYLHSLDEESQCGGAEDGWHLDATANTNYNLEACLILDAQHEAVDENPDDPTGTCRICGYANGFREDGWGHYTLAPVEYIKANESF